MHHPSTSGACCAAPSRRSTGATLRLKFLATLNRVRRRFRQRRVTLQSQLVTAHLS